VENDSYLTLAAPAEAYNRERSSKFLSYAYPVENEEQIREGLMQYYPDGMRQHIYPLGKITVIEDCYNASPESMKAAISVLSEYAKETGKRSIAVLGDMLELGTDSPSMHRGIGAYLATEGIERLYTVGTGAEQIAVGARQKKMPAERIVRASFADAAEQTAKRLLLELREGDAVLFKASRAMGLERIIACLKENL
jgi:UDP-N-acetylmuramoyl-tripeptide--D-alanyl-D-alanine ligase